MADNCELRQIYYEKLNALGQQEAKHQRSVEVLEAEKDMWLNRSGQWLVQETVICTEQTLLKLVMRMYIVIVNIQ